jgi:hypothetical protein
MKLYRFDPNTLVHPVGGFQDSPIWHNNSYVSMTDTCLKCFQGAQTNGCQFTEVTEADEFSAVKLTSAPVKRIRNSISPAIRAKYTLEDELKSYRTEDKEVAAGIEAIIKEKKLEIVALGFLS